MKQHQKQPRRGRSAAHKSARNRPDIEDLSLGNSRLPEEFTTEEKEALRQTLESLTGPTDAEFTRRFEDTVKAATGAANAGQDQEAERAVMKLLVMAGAKALKDPSPDLELVGQASACEERGDWAGAEKARRKVLVLRRTSEPVAGLAKAQFDLSRFLRLLGRTDEAWRYARAATKSARQADLAPLTVMFLENEAICALERKRFSHALAAAEEAMKLIGPERLQNMMRMRTLTLLAQCRLENGNEKAAMADLQSASELESNLVFGGLGGAAVTRARWWEVQAELQVRQGDPAGAIESLTKAAALRRESADAGCSPSPYALVARARGLERLAEIARQAGREPTGKEALREAKTLRKLAHLPSAPKEAPRRGRRRRSTRSPRATA